MNLKKLTTITAGIAISVSSGFFVLLSNIQPSLAEGKFVCGRNSKGEFVTFARTKTGLFPLIVWNKWEPGEWDRQKRCVDIRNRFNSFTSSDLRSLRAGTMKNHPVICAAKCTKLAITFPLKSNPESYLQQLKSLVGGANVPALELSTHAPFSYGDHGGLVLDVNNLLALEQYLPQESTANVQIIQEQTQNTNYIRNSRPAKVDEDGIVDVEDGLNLFGKLHQIIF
jgi:hypothetical protein